VALAGLEALTLGCRGKSSTIALTPLAKIFKSFMPFPLSGCQPQWAGGEPSTLG